MNLFVAFNRFQKIGSLLQIRESNGKAAEEVPSHHRRVRLHVIGTDVDRRIRGSDECSFRIDRDDKKYFALGRRRHNQRRFGDVIHNQMNAFALLYKILFQPGVMTDMVDPGARGVNDEGRGDADFEFLSR